MKKKQKRASGFLTGLLLLVLLLGVGVQLYRMQEKLKTARDEEAALAAQIAQIEQDPELISPINLGIAVGLDINQH